MRRAMQGVGLSAVVVATAGMSLVTAGPARASGGAPPTVSGTLTLSATRVTVTCNSAGQPVRATGAFAYDASRLTRTARVDLHWYTYGDDGHPVQELVTTRGLAARSAAATLTTGMTLTTVRPGLRIALSVDDHDGDGTWATTFRPLTCGRTGDLAVPTVTLGALQCDGSLPVTFDATRAPTGRDPWQVASFTSDGVFQPLGDVAAGERKQATLTNVALSNARRPVAFTFSAAPADYTSQVRAYGGTYVIRPSAAVAAGRC